MKKIISLILTLLIVFSSFNFNVFAKTNSVINGKARIIGSLEAEIHYALDDGVDYSDPRILSASKEAKEKILAGETEINISKYNFTYEEARAVFLRLFYGAPELFFLAQSYSVVPGFNDEMEELVVYLKYDEDEIPALEEEFYAYLDEVISMMPAGLSDLEKLIFIYQYVITAYDYDFSYAIYDAYTMIKAGKGVCQGYTNLMGAFLNRLGIENDFAESGSLNHIWNTVKINDKWYNLDATWDSQSGVAFNNWFLKSDEAFGRDVDIQAYPCTDKTFDNNGFIREIDGLVGFSGGRVYYNDGSAVKSSKIDGSDAKTEITLTSGYDWELDGSFAAITGGVLYYNDGRIIKARELSSGREAIIGTVESDIWVGGFTWSRNNDGFGYGMWAPNGQGSYSPARGDGFFPFKTFPTISGMFGDIDSSGKVNILDVRALLVAVNSGTSGTVSKSIGDIDGNNVINILDVRALLVRVNSGTI